MSKFYFFKPLRFLKSTSTKDILSFCSSRHKHSTKGDIFNFILKRDLNIKIEAFGIGRC